jgi:hypothetical protein
MTGESITKPSASAAASSAKGRLGLHLLTFREPGQVFESHSKGGGELSLTDQTLCGTGCTSDVPWKSCLGPFQAGGSPSGKT